MDYKLRYFTGFSLIMLLATLLFGLVASWAFLYPEFYNQYISFQQLHPMHVSAALFWIISGAVACMLYYSNDVKRLPAAVLNAFRAYSIIWIVTILVIFTFYAFGQYGGREYWEFPPFLCFPLLVSWLILMWGYLRYWFSLKDKKPMYIIMWATGIFFFFLTFLEQNLWQISWFRQSFIRELTIQWKANGSMVGAWNQMIYGTQLYLMMKISGDKKMAANKTVYFFYFLSLSNLMFNWGHHIYNVPSAGWIRHVAYFISMTEWLFFIKMIRSFRHKLDEHRKMKHIITYRFMLASELWLFLNLMLAIMMSIPAINRYTHGTHITVAHAMGTTIGINTMILLGAVGYMLHNEQANKKLTSAIRIGYNIANISLIIFWLALVVAGLMKGYRDVYLGMNNFNEMMQPVFSVLKVFSLAGIGVLTGMSIITISYLKALLSVKNVHNDTQTH